MVDSPYQLVSRISSINSIIHLPKINMESKNTPLEKNAKHPPTTHRCCVPFLFSGVYTKSDSPSFFLEWNCFGSLRWVWIYFRHAMPNHDSSFFTKTANAKSKLLLLNRSLQRKVNTKIPFLRTRLVYKSIL